MRKYKNGYYWLKFNKTYDNEVGFFNGGFWFLTGTDYPFLTKDIYKIGRKLKGIKTIE